MWRSGERCADGRPLAVHRGCTTTAGNPLYHMPTPLLHQPHLLVGRVTAASLACVLHKQGSKFFSRPTSATPAGHRTQQTDAAFITQNWLPSVRSTHLHVQGSHVCGHNVVMPQVLAAGRMPTGAALR